MSTKYEFKRLDKFFTDIDFLVPGHARSSQYMVAIHKAFYEWACPWVQDEVVLEAGCGEGYGAEILARSARRVVGVDIKPELVEHASLRYPSPNLNFEVMDCESMTYESESFGAVVCNELIEHLSDYESFLRGAQRVLRPEGIFLCATTNAALSFHTDRGEPLNRNHYQEFTAGQLTATLQHHFDHVRLYSQLANPEFLQFSRHAKSRAIERLLMRLGIKHKIPIRWRNAIRERLTGVRLRQAVEDGFAIHDGVSQGALYLIGVATKGSSAVREPFAGDTHKRDVHW